jgi:hypothetical protein
MSVLKRDGIFIAAAPKTSNLPEFVLLSNLKETCILLNYNSEHEVRKILLYDSKNWQFSFPHLRNSSL